MKSIVFFVALLLAASTHAQSGALATWQGRFVELSAGMPRAQAELKIAQVRGVNSTYELWAMDTSPLVAYRLDARTILIVTYQPGSPAAHVAGSSGNGGHPPLDGTLIRSQVLELR
ncbi:MAG: hypothetical protein ABI919_00745 [Ramlibacter sp.]